MYVDNDTKTFSFLEMNSQEPKFLGGGESSFESFGIHECAVKGTSELINELQCNEYCHDLYYNGGSCINGDCRCL